MVEEIEAEEVVLVVLVDLAVDVVLTLLTLLDFKVVVSKTVELIIVDV